MNYFTRTGWTVRADPVSSTAFGPVQRRVGQLHELNRITPILRKRSDPNADRNFVRTWSFGAAATDCGKIMFLDCRPHALSRDQALRVIRIEQKSRELLAAKAGADVAGPQCLLDYRADLFQGFAAHQVAVGVIHFLEIIDVHHQDTEGHRLGRSARGLATQLGKE